MKTYYDGEEREITGIKPYGIYAGVYLVEYKRGDSVGYLLVTAKDELEVYAKFPEELAKQSKNDEES